MCDMVLKLKKKTELKQKKNDFVRTKLKPLLNITGTRIKNVPLALTLTIPTVKPALPSSTEK